MYFDESEIRYGKIILVDAFQCNISPRLAAELVSLYPFPHDVHKRRRERIYVHL